MCTEFDEMLLWVPKVCFLLIMHDFKCIFVLIVVFTFVMCALCVHPIFRYSFATNCIPSPFIYSSPLPSIYIGIIHIDIETAKYLHHYYT